MVTKNDGGRVPPTGATKVAPVEPTEAMNLAGADCAIPDPLPLHQDALAQSILALRSDLADAAERGTTRASVTTWNLRAVLEAVGGSAGTMANGLTEAETRAIASVAGLTAPAQAEPVAWGQIGLLNGRSYLRMVYDRDPYPPPADVVRSLCLVPLYAAPAAQPQPVNAALREALQELHSWLVCWPIATPDDMAQSFDHMERVAGAALAAADAAQPVGLTDEQIDEEWFEIHALPINNVAKARLLARAVERAHGIAPSAKGAPR